MLDQRHNLALRLEVLDGSACQAAADAKSVGQDGLQGTEKNTNSVRQRLSRLPRMTGLRRFHTRCPPSPLSVQPQPPRECTTPGAA